MTGITFHPDRWTDQLLAEGYCIIPDALPAATIAALDADLDLVFRSTPFGQGRFYGNRTKRFGGLLKRSLHAQALILQPTILAIASRTRSIGGSSCASSTKLLVALEISGITTPP